MEENQYIKAVLHKLQCTRQKKKEIEKELRADIRTAIEAGETWESIAARMGDPAEAAQEFNENFSSAERKSVKKRKMIFVVCGIACVLVAAILLLLWYLPRGEMAKEKGKSHDETFSKVQNIISLLDEEDYETLRNEYANESMKEFLTKEQIDPARQQIASNWGERITFGRLYVSNIQQMGEKLKVVQINVSYEHASVTYTISFDTYGKLAGLYMK